MPPRYGELMKKSAEASKPKEVVTIDSVRKRLMSKKSGA